MLGTVYWEDSSEDSFRFEILPFKSDATKQGTSLPIA